MSAVPPAADLRLPPGILRLRRPALLVALVASVLCLVGLLVDAGQFFRSWLVAVVHWSGLALGCLAVLLLQHLTRGAWGLLARRPLEAGARTLPLLALLFAPLLLGLPSVYVWARPEAVAADEVLQHKAAWLDEPAFGLRALLFFVVWSGTALVMDRLSRREDEGASESTSRMRALAGPALGLYGLTASFAAVDWLMSLEAHWQSSLYGLWFIGGQALSALALVVLVALGLARHPPLDRRLRAAHFHDWGKLMLAFVMLWAYFSFSQFLLVWSADLPAEAGWYLRRSAPGWRAVAVVLAVLHFAVPFVLLLSRDLKRDGRRLGAVALLVLVMRWVDVYWQAGPAFDEGALPHWLDLAAALAVGGVWVAAFLGALASRPLLPVGAPGLPEALDAR